MEHARGGRKSWRLAVLTIGFISLLLLAIPAQAGLGDLLDNILDPVAEVPLVGDIVDPLVQGVIDPIVDDIVEPVAGGLVDPIADQVMAPVVNNVVPPRIEPVIETVPTTPPTTLPTRTADPEATTRESAGFDISFSDYPDGVLVADSSPDITVAPSRVTTERRSLEAALAVQAALIDNDTRSLVAQEAIQPSEVAAVEVGWLDGLTGWLQNGAGGIFDLLALPIRLLELLARALLTAGSGLIAPLSMLLAFTAYLIKDRAWSRA